MDLRLLDPRTLRALASTTRVEILRHLAKRPHTPTELARLLGLTEQTVTYHLDKLSRAGLASRRPEERRWAYHELTPDGRAIVEDAPTASGPLALVLALALAGAVLGYLWWDARPDPLPPNSMASPAPMPEWAPWAGIGAAILAGAAALLLAITLVAWRAARRLRSGRAPTP